MYKCSLLSDELKVAEFAHQLVAMAEYYKFDGWLVNIENSIHVSVIILIIIICTTLYCDGMLCTFSLFYWKGCTCCCPS